VDGFVDDAYSRVVTNPGGHPGVRAFVRRREVAHEGSVGRVGEPADDLQPAVAE
jgi:hypothetical protein